jgi:hypothetical protein
VSPVATAGLAVPAPAPDHDPSLEGARADDPMVAVIDAGD